MCDTKRDVRTKIDRLTESIERLCALLAPRALTDEQRVRYGFAPRLFPVYEAQPFVGYVDDAYLEALAALGVTPASIAGPPALGADTDRPAPAPQSP